MRSRGRLLIFLLVALAIGGWYFWPRLQNQLAVQNRTSSEISWLTIDDDDHQQSERLEHVTAGETRATKLSIGSENKFNVRGQFADNTTFQGGLVTYKTNESLAQRLVITITVQGQVSISPVPSKGL